MKRLILTGITFYSVLGMTPSALGNVISKLQATNTDLKVTYQYQYDVGSDFYQIFIDKDSNAKTGYQIGGIGAEIMIENGSVRTYKGTGTNWSFSVIGSATFSNVSKVVTISLDRKLIGETNLCSETSNVVARIGNNPVIVSSVLTQTYTKSQTCVQPAPTPSVTWTTCATEGGTCSFTGTREVRYGAKTSWNIKTITTQTPCTNAVFGDPIKSTLKSCQYSSITINPTPTPTPTPVPVKRDPLKQPFSSKSIWNMPIGSSAVYVPAQLSPTPGDTNIWATMPGIDEERIILTPDAPLTDFYHSSVGWSGGNRCIPDVGGEYKFSVPMPTNYIIPNSNLNESTVFLLKDKRTILQTQPVARCEAGRDGTTMATFKNIDLYGDGITGSHGGSGLSAIGGSLRLGELRPGVQPPKHALKVNVYAKEALFNCTTKSDCFRWPATTADSYAVEFYGTAKNNINSAMKMGALLAIPASVNINNLGLETEPAKQLAWTLQNYGAYVVDDTYAPGFALNVEEGSAGSKSEEFLKDWGFSIKARLNDKNPWMRDMQRLVKALHVVDNNKATSIGGGGTPRQPLAPEIIAP